MPTRALNYTLGSDQKSTDEKIEKLNCWDFFQCGREPNGDKADELCECPAATISALPDGQYNAGDYLGRRCWRMAGTLCNNQVQGTFAKKIESCRQCLFYLKVKAEEGDSFVE